MKRSTESDLIRVCLRLLALCGVMAWRTNNIPVYDPSRKRYRSFRGTKGVADILAVLPGGKLLAIETKLAKGKLSPDQTLFLDGVNAAGGVGVCVRDVKELEKMLEKVLDSDCSVRRSVRVEEEKESP